MVCRSQSHRLRRAPFRVILALMPDWEYLSIEDRKRIEHRLMGALYQIGIKGAVTRWESPTAYRRYWQLKIQTSWCANKHHKLVLEVLEQAMARADVEAPKLGIVLSKPPAKQVPSP